MNAGWRVPPADDLEALAKARLGDSDRRPEVVAEQSQRCRQVWEAVILQMIEDALYVDAPPNLSRRHIDYKRSTSLDDRARAIAWLSGGSDFSDVCERAGRNPDVTRRRVRAYLAEHGVILP